jgi:glycine amidinotransferase/scyllo-inosamine-4-phosphate amidinotransferase 1
MTAIEPVLARPPHRAGPSDPLLLVNAHNEWDPLEEVIIGTASGAQVPIPDQGLLAIEFGECDAVSDIPSGPLSSTVIKETEEELEILAEALLSLGITVRRPDPRDHTARVTTPDWSTDGFYDCCPRDVLLTIGSTVIEAPMVLRSRFLESFAYKSHLLDYLASGARWLAAPRPRLLDTMYERDAPAGRRLQDLEPAFDAANVLRFGTDILYLVSDSGNEMGARWLQSMLGDEYTVRVCRDLYAQTHVDSTLAPLRPGLVLINPARVTDVNMPQFLRGWDVIKCPDLVDTGFVGAYPRCSKWIGMNLLMVAPDLAIVDDRQTSLIRLLERQGIDVMPLRLTHARSLGGGFHCVSLDIRRKGKLESYC